MIDLFLLVCAGLVILYFSLKLLGSLLARILPLLFVKRIQELEADRLAGIQRLQDMGIQIVSDEDNPRNYTTIR